MNAITRFSLVLSIILLLAPLSQASQMRAFSGLSSVGETTPSRFADQDARQVSKRKFWQKRDANAESRTGLIALLSSGLGSATLLLTLFLTGPQILAMLGTALILAGIGLAIYTLVTQKGKPRSRDWKFGLTGLLLGALPLLFVGLILLGFYLQ
ncbi:MAG: hypothetical protein NWR72_16595 [Bacteroidia bacterium]|nr:hypothetical protein [Bacteroidia bacterium]